MNQSTREEVIEVIKKLMILRKDLSRLKKKEANMRFWEIFGETSKDDILEDDIYYEDMISIIIRGLKSRFEVKGEELQ